MTDKKVLEVLDRYQGYTQDPDLQVAIKVTLDWRSAASYYQDQTRLLTIENQRLRDQVNALKTKVHDIRNVCSCKEA